MRARTVASEALRNLLAGTTRAGFLALALTVVAVVAATLDLLTITGQQHQSREFRESAAAVRILSVPGQVAADGCDRLAGTGNISAAGALRPTDPLTPVAAPDNPVPAFVTTPGLRAVLGVDDPGIGAWLPDDLADTLGVRPGGVLESSAGPVPIAGTYPWPDDGRDPRLAYAVLLPAPATGLHEECWVATWPMDRTDDELLRTAAVVDPTGGDPLTISQANNNLGATYQPHLAFESRPTRLMWIATGATAFLLGLVSARRRRLEHASSLHAGQCRPAQLAVITLETLAWAIAAAVTSTAVFGTVIVAISGTDHTALADGQLNGVLASLVAAPLGAAVGTLLTSESHLFRYFRDR